MNSLFKLLTTTREHHIFPFPFQATAHSCSLRVKRPSVVKVDPGSCSDEKSCVRELRLLLPFVLQKLEEFKIIAEIPRLTTLSCLLDGALLAEVSEVPFFQEGN